MHLAHVASRVALASGVLAVCTLLPACGFWSAPPPALNAKPAPARDPVGTFTSLPWTFSTSSYWIEGPTGLVLIDTQFTPSAAERFLAVAEGTTGKKAALAIVLHANPDKFNGTSYFQKRGIKVVTSSQVRALIPAIFKKRTEAFAERYAPDWPTETPAPESFGDATTVVEAAGLTIKLHVMGPGCSEAHVVAEWKGHLFAGDLVANGAHSWLEIGEPEAWLDRVREMQAIGPATVHAGRSGSGGPELLTRQVDYLRAVIAAVAAEKPTMPPPAGALDRVATTITRAYPNYDFSVFLNIGLPAVWEHAARTPR